MLLKPPGLLPWKWWPRKQYRGCGEAEEEEAEEEAMRRTSHTFNSASSPADRSRYSLLHSDAIPALPSSAEGGEIGAKGEDGSSPAAHDTV